ILTASPPRDVSLYFVFMSAPVCRMVSITSSNDTRCVPSPRSASDAAATALLAPNALRSMHGICTRPPTSYTMQEEFYTGRLRTRHDLLPLIPNAQDRASVHAIIFD